MRSFFNRERYKNGQAVKVPRDAKRQPVGWVRQRGNTELCEWVGEPWARWIDNSGQLCLCLG